jgi:hypothetical protein
MLQSNQARTTTPSAPPPPSAAELREQIQATIQAAREASTQDAAQAAREAAQLGRDAAQAGRDAAQAAREAAQATQGRGTFTLFPPPAPPSFQDSFPPQIEEISIAFFVCCAVMVIGWPLARAFGRRIERRAESPAINPAMADQLQRIEQAVDAMSIEIERISESQRFMARLQNAQTPERLPADRS